MNKKCPLLGAWPKCEKEKCAWYLVHNKQCAIPLIPSRIELLVEIYRVPDIEKHLQKISVELQNLRKATEFKQ